MIHRVLRVGRWVVDFLFATKDYDIDGVLACMRDCRAERENIDLARRKMERGNMNEGLTYTNPELFRAVVLVGPTTSGRQFQNTFVHEMRHVVDVIARTAGIENDPEEPAYLSGDTAMELADVVCRLGCGHCRCGAAHDD